MGQHHITYACGHDQTVQLYGNARDRESRAQWLAGTDCGDCFKAQRDQERAEENQQNAEANKAAGLPELDGSPKQVEWAETIRAQMLGDLARERTRLTGLRVDEERQRERKKRLDAIVTAHAALAEVASAKWFIDHRHQGAERLAQLAALGRLGPRTQEQKTIGFDPFGLNELVFPAVEVGGHTQDERRVRLRLVHSRWEGCTALHPVSMTQEEPDGSMTVRFGGDWSISIHDGARTRTVSAEEFHQDRTDRRADPGERHYWGMPPYTVGEWNEFDVPEADVSETQREGSALTVVQLLCSRWEGLRFEHPTHLVRRHRLGFVTVRFGPYWQFRVRGGRNVLQVEGQQLYEDRASPLPEPGESLAVEEKAWHEIFFHPSRVRRGKDTWWTRLPPDGPWPDAVIHHPVRMCTTEEDSAGGYVTWRFHEDWTFHARTPDSGTVEVSAEELKEATSGWAGTAPAPGTFTRQPQDLVPADEVTIPAELLEDDPSSPLSPDHLRRTAAGDL